MLAQRAPVYHKATNVGYVEDGYYFTERVRSQHMLNQPGGKLWKTYGISEDVFEQLFRLEVTNIHLKETREDGSTRALLSRVSDWMVKDRRYVDPKDRTDLQYHLRPTEMRDALGEPIPED